MSAFQTFAFRSLFILRRGDQVTLSLSLVTQVGLSCCMFSQKICSLFYFVTLLTTHQAGSLELVQVLRKDVSFHCISRTTTSFCSHHSIMATDSRPYSSVIERVSGAGGR
ncbi:unnamed protein product [Ascophyllum nodosum]